MTGNARPREASMIVPLEYLKSYWSHDQDQNAEALFLTFNTDPTFFEARILDGCRAAGAVVTVIADAAMWAPDVGSVRSAGLEYHVGLVAHRRAFHPKVSLLVGSQRAIAIVGSGNMGLAGWQRNSETATVLHGDLDSAPAALADLRDVLGTLPSHADLDSTSAAAVVRIVEQLTDLLRLTARIHDTGHHIRASWDGPLQEHLPTGPIDELSLTAAFHDLSSEAVRLLLQRTRPRRVRVAVQPGWTVFNPLTLRGVLSDFAAETGADVAVVRDVDSAVRYRHGKLIEWVVNGERMALTGSPNLTSAALLSDASTGNHEVAIIGPIGISLFPEGEVLDLDSPLPSGGVIATGAGSRRGAPVIIAAVLTDTGVRLNLAHVTTTVGVEVLSTAQADEWTLVGDAGPGSTVIDLPAGPLGGTPVRLAWTTAEGEHRHSSAQFVTDGKAALQPRPTRNPTQFRAPGELADLWNQDLAFIEGVRSRLAGYATDPPATIPPLDNTRRRGGQRGGAGDSRKVVPWAWERDGIIDVPLQDPSDEEQVRAARREWANRATKKAPTVALWVQIYFLVGTLTHWRRAVWDDWDDVPQQLAQQLLRAVLSECTAPSTDGSPETIAPAFNGGHDVDGSRATLQREAAVVAAIALLHLRERINPNVHDANMLAYVHLKHDCAALLGELDQDLASIQYYLRGIEGADVSDLFLDPVTTLAKETAAGDPLGDVAHWLERKEKAFRVTRPSINTLHVVGSYASARLKMAALEVVGWADEEDGIAIWVSNPQGEWALAVWRRPSLVIVTQRGDRQVAAKWQRLEFRGVMTAAALAQRSRELGFVPTDYDVEVTRPKYRPTDRAVSVLKAVGLAEAKPPTDS